MKNIVIFIVSPPYSLVYLIFIKMTFFLPEGKVEFTVFAQDFGISWRNVCVLCLVSIWELLMCLRMKGMMITTMLLDPFIRFQSWVILVWNKR
jgi:hypothetical protein